MLAWKLRQSGNNTEWVARLSTETDEGMSASWATHDQKSSYHRQAGTRYQNKTGSVNRNKPIVQIHDSQGVLRTSKGDIRMTRSCKPPVYTFLSWEFSVVSLCWPVGFRSSILLSLIIILFIIAGNADWYHHFFVGFSPCHLGWVKILLVAVGRGSVDFTAWSQNCSFMENAFRRIFELYLCIRCVFSLVQWSAVLPYYRSPNHTLISGRLCVKLWKSKDLWN